MQPTFMVAQTGTPKSSCAARAVSTPSATPISAAASNRRHAPPLIVSMGGMSFLARLDIANEDPMCRLQPAIRPDNGRDDRREPLLCFDVIKRGMTAQNSRGRAKPPAVEIVRHYLRRSRPVDEPLNISLTLRGRRIFRRRRTFARRGIVATSDDLINLVAGSLEIPRLIYLAKQSNAIAGTTLAANVGTRPILIIETKAILAGATDRTWTVLVSEVGTVNAQRRKISGQRPRARAMVSSST